MTEGTESVAVRYAKAADGSTLAYLDRGEGTPIVVLPFHFSHARLRARSPYDWSWGLAHRFRTISYDGRGQGLSSRNLDRPPTIEDYASDLERVLEHVGLERAVLVAYGGFAHIAIRYAAAHPERVPALVLLCASESFSSWPMVGMSALAEENWELFVDLMAGKFPVARARESYADFLRASTSSAGFVQMVRAFKDSTVSDVLESVSVPTLVLHSLNQHWLSPEAGERFTAQIPGAQMVLLEGDSEPDSVEGVKVATRFLASLGLEAPTVAAAATPGVSAALTQRQNEILRLIAQGKTNREVAQALFLSERTVERHLGEIYARLGARNRGEAISFALRHG